MLKFASTGPRFAGERLVALGVVTPEQLEHVWRLTSHHGGRIEDMLVEIGYLTEAALLQTLSNIHRTQFVSTQKLYRAQTDPRMFALVPFKAAHKHTAFPILFDAATLVLTVATPDPDNTAGLQDLKFAASARDVRAVVARPAAVLAAISRGYLRDTKPFDDLMRAAQQGPDVSQSDVALNPLSGQWPLAPVYQSSVSDVASTSGERARMPVDLGVLVPMDDDGNAPAVPTASESFGASFPSPVPSGVVGTPTPSGGVSRSVANPNSMAPSNRPPEGRTPSAAYWGTGPHMPSSAPTPPVPPVRPVPSEGAVPSARAVAPATPVPSVTPVGSISSPASFPDLSAPEEVKEGVTIGGRYVVGPRLGAGGMGTVHEGKHLGTNRRVAIKILPSDLARQPGLVQRFEIEAKSAGQIESRHIAQVLDVGVHGANPYLVMEYLDGEDLHHLVRRVGPLHPQLAIRIVAQACAGLVKAHEAGIIHRDVKPANIFLARQDGDIVVKLVDFGIAKVRVGHANAEGGLTSPGKVFGSPFYMSPEQIRAPANVDGRTDIWSMGIVLYECLSGTTPFHTLEGLAQVIFAICTQPIPSLQERAPWVPHELLRITWRALQPDLAQRYAHTAEMLAELRALAPSGLTIDESALGDLRSRDRTGPHPAKR